MRLWFPKILLHAKKILLDSMKLLSILKIFLEKKPWSGDFYPEKNYKVTKSHLSVKILRKQCFGTVSLWASRIRIHNYLYGCGSGSFHQQPKSFFLNRDFYIFVTSLKADVDVPSVSNV